jgi:hypothetical protein
MAEPSKPGPGRSTADAAFSELTKEIARRNEEAHKVARRVRQASEKEKLARRAKWDRM